MEPQRQCRAGRRGGGASGPPGRLGHRDPAFTLRVYAHMLPCSHDRARAVINECFTQAIGVDA
jgi:hypothetical protein